MGKRKSTGPTAEIAVTSIKTERSLLDAFKEAAHARDRTMAQELRWLMRERVKEHEAEREDQLA
jgi:hypothetical protein